MDKSLDRKLAAIRADPNTREFILADAKDADMAFGIGAPGLSPEAHSGELRHRTLEEYRDQMRKFYYDPTKHNTYLDQLGIKYPTLRQNSKR